MSLSATDGDRQPERVDPLPGWAPHSEYGFLRANSSDAGRLVRVETVLEWQMESMQRPLKLAIIETMSQLITEWGREASNLYVLSSSDYAVPLVLHGRPNPAADHVWSFFPEIDSGADAEQVARGVAEGWLWAWPGLAGRSNDPKFEHERILDKNRIRVARARATREGRDYQGPDWPSDDLILLRLRLLAIPIWKAHELWGWGTTAVAANPLSEPEKHPVGDVAEQATAAVFPFPGLAPVDDIQDPQNWRQLVNFRRSYPRARWTDSMRAIALREKKDRASKPGARGVVDAMAAELHITPKVLNEQILKASRNNGASPSLRGGIHK